MLERLHDNTVRDIRYLVGDGIKTLRDWALRGASTSLDHVPRDNLDEAVREARKQPRFSITSGSMSVRSGNEASGKLTHQVAGTTNTQRQPGGTDDSEMREIPRKAFKSWEGVHLVDFFDSGMWEDTRSLQPQCGCRCFPGRPIPLHRKGCGV
ncbi:unnamed protein product [Trypanosoma congolense IL3000]|uniref:WGS project CAEQ00000000 data, annotated contig 2292 n=1 Tax=Trypanosoma congolense (strain IL3000) TaxID=1068625 RepID=F9WCY5_TRYCI|nr:unnamed protein product [Trypanosoma congolense IL3000]